MFPATQLRTTPLFVDWTVFGTIHVFDERIIPSRRFPGQALESARHRIQFIDAQWCDMAELSEGEFCAPDGEVGVANTLALLARFSNASNAPTKARAELFGVGTGAVGPIGGIIGVSDLLALLSAFSGTPYSFPPPVN